MADSNYARQVEASRDPVFVVGKYLTRLGKSIQMAVRPVRQDGQAEEADDGDLWLMQRVEVKRRTFEFDSVESYPFDTVYLYRKEAYDLMHPKPVSLLILNSSMTHALVARLDTRQHWEVAMATDARPGRGYSYQVYSIKKNHLFTVSLGS